MKLYHYTSVGSWDQVKGLLNTPAGLTPKYAFDDRMGPTLFALLEPTPKTWFEQTVFEGAGSGIKAHLKGRMLLEIEVDRENPNIFVADFAYKAAMGYKMEDRPDRFRIYGGELFKRYMQSRVLLRDYVGNEKGFQYILPEAHILEYVPFDNIQVSQQQPYIEAALEDPEYNSHLLRNFVARTPELEPWLFAYRSRLQESSEGTPRHMRL